jgi:hypothetical protein
VAGRVKKVSGVRCQVLRSGVGWLIGFANTGPSASSGEPGCPCYDAEAIYARSIGFQPVAPEPISLSKRVDTLNRRLPAHRLVRLRRKTQHLLGYA